MKWYMRTWVCVLFLILFFPVGIFLTWKYHKDWKFEIKIVASIASVVLFLCITVFSKPTILPSELQISSGSSISMDLDETVELSIEVAPAGADISQLEFHSSDSTVATFEPALLEESQGILTAIHEGSVTIFVQCGDVVSNRIDVTISDEGKVRVDEVEDLISRLGDITLESMEDIIAARVAYDNLSYEERADVENYSILVAAEDTLSRLETATPIIAAISQLGTVTVDDETTVARVRSQYDRLPEDVKPLVDNYDVLLDAEETIANEKQQLQQVAEVTTPPPQTTPQTAPQTTPPPTTTTTNAPAAWGTVYWTPGGEKYHVSANCPTLARSSKVYSGSIDEAKAAGKGELCKVCG